jgi:hypothetical protein
VPEINQPTAPPPIVERTGFRRFLAVVLSLYLAGFVIDAVLSLADDGLRLGLHFPLLSLPRLIVSAVMSPLWIFVYGFIAFVPAVPKRYFLPLALFFPVQTLLWLWILIYWSSQMLAIQLLFSVLQCVLAAVVVSFVCRERGFKWPLLSIDRLTGRLFSWPNLIGFVAVNLFVFLPAILVYLACCTSMAVDHFTDHFMKLSLAGISVKSEELHRNDGKTIFLMPTVHVGESGFYARLSDAIPTNSIVLMEGVTDRKNHLHHKLQYKKLASALGLQQQVTEFDASRGDERRADVDIDDFTPTTIEFIEMVSRLHSEGLKAETLLPLIRKSQDQKMAQTVWSDILDKRNTNLLSEIHNALNEGDNIVVPWGVAHMPGLKKALTADGFEVKRTAEYTVVNFGKKPVPQKN